MPLTRSFKETVQARVRRDEAFRKELLRESVECFVLGDVETGKAVLRDYINATVGFAELAEVTQHSAKSLMRMLSPSGNPQARNLFEIVEYLQRREKVHFQVVASIRRGLAQARKGVGRPVDKVFDELEQRLKPSLKTGLLSQR
ncbi:MAG: transcriptional regulator [Terriglobales bacterium]|jgi:DNA-binding phage protein